MVKADPKRDYYADLDLPANADEDQIKKQFRLLAKQYHPDRNPGHEVEFVSKFQAVQAAHEILSDSAEKAKYDAARAKQHRASEPKFPPPPKDDPYNFRKPARAQTTSFAPPPPPPPPQQKPKPRPTPQQAYANPRQGPAPSPGAEKLGAFARGAQRWDRAAWEEASRNEGMRGFQRMPAGGPPPQMPPRPMRQHPTAPRPPSNPVSPDVPNGNPGFPGLSRTNSTRRMQFPDEMPPPRSAYQYVRADRPPPSAAAHSYDTFSKHSPPMTRAQPATDNPLRHARSTEQTRHPDRPQMYPRQSNRYATNVGERTDLRGGASLGRSASVRNSPVDPKFDDESGPFGNRPHSHLYPAQSQAPPPRHRSASPKMRQASYSSSSSGSEDGPVHMKNPGQRPTAEPKSRRPQRPDGLDSFFPSSNYTRVVDDQPPDTGSYYYPPPQKKDLHTRQPFPNMTTPDDPQAGPRNSFSTSTATAEQPAPDPVFQPAKFQHHDWAERLRQDSNTSPTKQQRGSRSKEARRPTISTSNSGDAMDVDPSPTDTSKPRANGISLDDLKAQVPFTSNGGLNGMADDLKSKLPFESRPSAYPHLRKSATFPESRLKITDLPRPPKLIHPPSDDCLDRQNWTEYIDGVRKYVDDWAMYEEKMIDHFHTRNRLVRTMMADNWVTSVSDGPSGNAIDETDFGPVNGDKKAGFGTYMEWMADDKVCHVAWETACDRHRGCMQELGRVRDKIKKMGGDEN